MNPTISYRVQYAAWPIGRWAEQAWWRKAWVRFWDWFFYRLWRSWLRPHLMPRRYAREHTRDWAGLRLPPEVHGYVWEEDSAFVGTVRGGELGSGLWFQGDTRRAAKDDVYDFLGWCEQEAGTLRGSWVVVWHYEEPPDA